MKNPKHVIQYFTQFTFKLTVNGDKVLPNAWWVTKSAASFYAELSKWYYRNAFGLDHHTVRIAPHFTSESLIAEATNRGIVMTNPAEVLPYLPKGIQHHVDRFGGELRSMAAMNLDTGYQKCVSSVRVNLRNAISAVSHGAEVTTGEKQEFLKIVLPVLQKYADDFEAGAASAAQPKIV